MAVFNLAPYSFFNTVSSEPPLVMISTGLRSDGRPKDTRENVKQRQDFLIHIASVAQLEDLNASSATLSAQQRYNDTHAKLEPTTRIKNKDEPALNAQAIAQLIPCSNSTTSQAIAAIYVWLGSSMGANIIVRRLEAMTLDIPTEYYQAMAGCAKAWVSFKQEVETLLPELGLDNESFVKNAVQDANAWFEFLISLGKRTAPNATPYHEASV